MANSHELVTSDDSCPSPMRVRQKLLIANRGEIAVRIIRTAKELGIATLAVYTPSDTLSPHVSMADEAIALSEEKLAQSGGKESESKAYLDGPSIIAICRSHDVTLLHPGYGFLSENADFAYMVLEAGITWLGPRPEVIQTMGRKHEARTVAIQAGVPVVPGSEGLLDSADSALRTAEQDGYPVLLKASAGGGGMGMIVCSNQSELLERFSEMKQRAKALFADEALFLEKYFPKSHHIEVQVFGNGMGDVVHMGERECSIQRRHQKIIEEAPSPFCSAHLGLTERICEAALRLCRLIKYGSAGTVEFLVDDETAGFYFLEMNTRIQVEHPVTEAIHPGLDLVRLMIRQGVSEQQNGRGIMADQPEMDQSTYDGLRAKGSVKYAHAIEGRVYAENPAENFTPSPGLLQHVELKEHECDWLRIETWVSSGLSVTPFFDPLLCKIIVSGSDRAETVSRFEQALSLCKIQGPPNNIEYLRRICSDKEFRGGSVTTQFSSAFNFTPHSVKVLHGGLEATVQDLPGRTIGFGVPRSGPMDSLAFSVGNILVGNPPTTEGLEIVLLPGFEFALQFHVAAVVAVTGRDVLVKVDGGLANMWSSVVVPRGGKLQLAVNPNEGKLSSGFRTYMNIRGGFPNIPAYLGSKSTSMGLSGYQGRSLLPGDEIALGECGPETLERPPLVTLPDALIPKYPSHWVIHVLAGPHDDEEFVTKEGIQGFYSTTYEVGPASNRMGIRLQSPNAIGWARENGGEGGSHPSNILDNGYTVGTININGDTPVILGLEGPDMGGYLCMSTVASADLWKLGQLSPGDEIEFRRVSWQTAQDLKRGHLRWMRAAMELLALGDQHVVSNGLPTHVNDIPQSPILNVFGTNEDRIVFRQAGDSAVLVEFGTMQLSIECRALIHTFESIITNKKIRGTVSLCPCIRSIMCHYDPEVISQNDFLAHLVSAYESLPKSVDNLEFPGRRITFPIVLDDRWNREALTRYMKTIRSEAVYLPSNIEYLARNNGLTGGAPEALSRLIKSDWIVLGVGFYLACPFMVPIDPRCRLNGQKMNPSRTYTPRGAIGIAGPVAAIYPVESPGGYQLYGRTLPTWHPWGAGPNFSPNQPWLLRCFDQVHFVPVSEAEYLLFEREFDMGRYNFKIEETTFSMKRYASFTADIIDEVAVVRQRQIQARTETENRERELLEEWEQSKRKSGPADSAGQHPDEAGAGHDILRASVFASVWKIKCQPGDVVKSPDDVLLLLDAMKAEIAIRAGESNVGKVVKRLGKNIREQATVRPGDELVVFV